MANSVIKKQVDGNNILLATLNSAGDTTLSESILNFALIGIQITDSDIYAPFMIIPSSILYNTTANANICIVAWRISTSAISNSRIWYDNSTDKITVRAPAKVYGIMRK